MVPLRSKWSLRSTRWRRAERSGVVDGFGHHPSEAGSAACRRPPRLPRFRHVHRAAGRGGGWGVRSALPTRERRCLCEKGWTKSSPGSKRPTGWVTTAISPSACSRWAC